jgi:hypothetical protein
MIDVVVAVSRKGDFMAATVESPETVIKNYTYAHWLVYGSEPEMHYIGNGWYRINGEMVHHRLITEETDRLRDLARQKRLNGRNRSMVQRLIDRLRSI